MTRHLEPDGQAAHHWLTQHQHGLSHALDEFLDTEAGLREILLHSGHDTATDNLDTVLDTEAGLADILPIPTSATDGTRGMPHHHTEPTELLRTLSSADRMALRNEPDVKTASLALAQDLDIAHAGIPRDLDVARILAIDLANAIVRDLDLVLVRDLVLDPSFKPAMTRARAIAIDRARVLSIDLARDTDRARALDLAGAINRARELDRHRVYHLDLERAFGRACDLDRAFERARDLELDRYLDLNLDLGIIVDIRTTEVGRAIGLVRRCGPVMLDKDSLYALLDDFTTTDLSTVDLTGVDLSGVHWSEHTTQWPPAIDVEDLKVRSDESPPGSGTWIVRSGTATIRDLAER
ncbi:hypothetical protein OG410_41615 [Streptomyces sp. NBC_00659]|uniref:hypothetical protein n=1 Tax=Streptomyces sp. NBC_00659 TaxID=2903669 RepID=UPI002E3221D7|nr:hypothetical protein [Streptomyces sp. NBC_00659]